MGGSCFAYNWELEVECSEMNRKRQELNQEEGVRKATHYYPEKVVTTKDDRRQNSLETVVFREIVLALWVVFLVLSIVFSNFVGIGISLAGFVGMVGVGFALRQTERLPEVEPLDVCELGASTYSEMQDIILARYSSRSHSPDKLIPMDGKLTKEILQHNLRIVGKDSGYDTQADNIASALDAIADYYYKLDQLVVLGFDSRGAAKVRQDFEKNEAEIYLRVKVMVCLLAVMELDSSMDGQFMGSYEDFYELVYGETFRQPLREYALAELQKMRDMPNKSTTAEEIARIQELTDSILTGSRGNQPILMSEIYPDASESPIAFNDGAETA